MKTFLNKIILFAFLFLTLIVVFILSIYAQFKGLSYQLDQSTKTIILGHSHPETAYDDRLIINTENLSESGESYFYTFQKVKSLLGPNNQIDYVLIEFSNNQIDISMNEWIWGDKYIDAKLEKYWLNLGFNDLKVLISHNWPKVFNSLPRLVQRSDKYWFRRKGRNLKNYLNLGGYNNLTNSNVDSLLAEGYLEKTKVSNEISEMNMEYLCRIIEYAQLLGKKVFLIRTPTHESYAFLSNWVLYEQVRNRYSNFDLLDFQSYPLLTNDFADPGHLNFSGAKKLSTSLNFLIKKGLLEDESPQDLICEHIQLLKFDSTFFITYDQTN